MRTPLKVAGRGERWTSPRPGRSPASSRKGGGRAYFHGGLSPQELIIPVVVADAEAQGTGTPTGIEWTLSPGRRSYDPVLLRTGRRRGTGPVRVRAAEGAGRGAGEGQGASRAGERLLRLRGSDRRRKLKVGRKRPQASRTEHGDGDGHRGDRARRRWASTCSMPPPGRNWRALDKVEVAISI